MSIEIYHPGLKDEFIRLGKAMHDEGPYKATSWDGDKVAKAASMPNMFCALYKNSEGAFIGLFLGGVQEQYFGHDRVAFELALYVLPEFRCGLAAPRLVSAFEAWAKEQGANCAYISTSFMLPAAERFLNRAGYETIGAVTRKEL